MTPIESLPAKWPDRIVLWSRGVSPHWYFVAAKSERPDIKGSPVYETLDPIVLKGSPEALAAQLQDGELLALADDLRNGGLSEEPTNEFLRGLRAGKRHAADMIESLASRRVVDDKAVWATSERWDEWLQHAIAKYPEAEAALLATRVAMGPAGTITAEDIARATAALQPAPLSKSQINRIALERGESPGRPDSRGDE